MGRWTWLGMVLASMVLGAMGCSNGLEESTGAACEVIDDCYPNLEPADLSGAPACLADRVTGGYCTHGCTQDSDCCAGEGECVEGLSYVCAPLESTGQKYCFVSCEGGAGDGYCQENAHESFGCRSTGGGNQNRKVCLP